MSDIKGAKAILEEMNTGYLRDKLLEYPGQIVALKKQVRVLRERADEAEQQRAMLEAIMVQEIADEVDAMTKKARFGNEKARTAELMLRKGASSEYQEAAREAKGAMFDVNELEDELEGVENLFKATRFVTRLLAAELEFMAEYDEGTDAEDFGRSLDWPDRAEKARRDEQAY